MPKKTRAFKPSRPPLQEHERLEQEGWVFVKSSRIHRGRLGSVFYSLCEAPMGLGEQQTPGEEQTSSGL